MAVVSSPEGGPPSPPPWRRRASPRQARQAARIVPVIGCIPGSEVWFFRFALAFLAHLGQGGRSSTGCSERVVGNAAAGPSISTICSGGPLLWAPNLIRPGPPLHRPCGLSGVRQIAAGFPWWQDTRSAPRVSTTSMTGSTTRRSPSTWRRTPSADLRGQASTARPGRARPRAVLVYPDPLEQAAATSISAAASVRPAYNTLDGRRLSDLAVSRLPVRARPAVVREALPLLSGMAKASARLGHDRAVRRLHERSAETLA